MYSWYQGATECYAYLADVPTNVDTNDLDSAFAKSKWFKRGWTLQELNGLLDLILFSRDWINHIFFPRPSPLTYIWYFDHSGNLIA